LDADKQLRVYAVSCDAHRLRARSCSCSPAELAPLIAARLPLPLGQRLFLVWLLRRSACHCSASVTGRSLQHAGMPCFFLCLEFCKPASLEYRTRKCIDACPVHQYLYLVPTLFFVYFYLVIG